MTESLSRFTRRVSGPELEHALSDGGVGLPPLETISGEAPLEEVAAAIAAIRAESGGIPPASDRKLAPVVHSALKNSERRVLLDVRFWQWLTVVRFKDYVLDRWCSDVRFEEGVPLRNEERQHFLGGTSLVGTARNALARLFWSADILWTAEDGYTLAQAALERQDLFTGIFERELCLYPEAARSCVRQLRDVGEKRHRAALRRLNFLLSTTVLETLDSDSVARLLVENGVDG